MSRSVSSRASGAVHLNALLLRENVTSFEKAVTIHRLTDLTDHFAGTNEPTGETGSQNGCNAKADGRNATK